jgi:hypothetical protein
MNAPPSSEPVTPDSPEESASSASELESIRELLFGREKKQLEVLQERIQDPGLHAQDVSQVLPQAVVLSLAKDA